MCIGYKRKDGTVAGPNPRQLETIRRRKIGRRIAGFLQPRATVLQVAKQLGISPQMVRNIEEEALYKVACQVRGIMLEKVPAPELADNILPGAPILEAFQ